MQSKEKELQFKAWQANIGYLLHPAITQHEHMRIADVGTGTGIWLQELANVLPSSCQLDGFDISDALLPDKSSLPENITFYLQNLLQPFPEQFIGKYDVVNVRVMVVALSSNEWEPAVRNLMTLLRPGGHLQWVDCAAHECIVKAPEGANPVNANRGMDLFRKTMNALGKTPSIAALHGIFQESGLDACEEQIFTLTDPEVRDNLNLSVATAIAHCLTAALKLHKLEDIQSEEEIADLKKGMLEDLRTTHCWFCYDVYVVVGRKS
ncbi:hypothetical protein PoHVEF18_006042 [Penicillium ochrochloron]